MAGKTPLIKWQLPMKRVLYALIPLVVGAVYFYGWRALLLLAVVNTVAFLAERAFTRGWKEPVSSAVFVTGTLFTLSLPSTLPFWMAVLGILFAVVFGKMVFGGFGKNIFNPALSGRAFLYVCFGDYMAARWAPAFRGWPGGFAHYAVGADAVTSATPGMLLKTGLQFDFWPMFLGNVSGTIGGTSALLAIVGGSYILWKKAANHRIVISCFAGHLGIQTVLWVLGVKNAVSPLYAVLGGSFVVGALFYATDPVSACKTNEGRWMYGAFIGVMSSLITVFSAWPAGTMFSILLANMFASITDHAVKEWKSRGKAKAAQA